MCKRPINANNSELTGHKGVFFEHQVQAAFSLMMLCGSPLTLFYKTLKQHPIIKAIAVQKYHLDYNTDDMLITANNAKNDIKLLCQIKSSICFNNKDKDFKEVLKRAWKDYNNDDKFHKGVDKIVIITGLLNKSDTDHTRRILELAHSSENSLDLRSQLSTIREKKLNSIYNAFPENTIHEKEKFEFLQHLVLYTYDLEIEGTVLPLIYTVIPTVFKSHAPQAVWGNICDYWAERNFVAGHADRILLLEHLKKLFPDGKDKKDVLTEHEEATLIQQPMEVTNVPEYEYSQLLLRLFFVTSWIDNNEADKAVVATLLGVTYNEGFEEIRRLVTSINSPLRQGQARYAKDSSFTIKKPLAVWKIIAPKLLINDLNIVKHVFHNVFKAGKNSYSTNIRQGLATSLAIFANNHGDITNITDDVNEKFVSDCLYNIHDWDEDVNWEQIDDVVALFAEASPSYILNRLEKALDNGSQYLDAVFKDNNLYLLRSTRQILINCLADLAYEPQYLDKSVAILGKLASNYSTLSDNDGLISTITQIFLPWYPHTMSGFDEQFDSLRLLHKESPTIYYEVLLRLLPNKITTSLGGRTASWRKVVPENWDERKVLLSDYIKTENRICELLLEYCSDNPIAIIGIVDNISNFMPDVFDKAVDVIKNTNSMIGDEQKLRIWHILDNEISRHRYFADADWAMSDDKIDKLAVVNELYTPHDIIEQSIRLFGWDAYTHDDIYERESYDKQKAALNEKRIETITHIFALYEIEGVKKLILKAKNIRAISKSCAEASFEIGSEEIKDMLTSDDRDIKCFIFDYMQIKMYKLGCDWAKSIDITGWDAEEKSWFFSALPFSSTYWRWAESELVGYSDKYWSKLWSSRFIDSFEHDYAVERLLEYENISAAIECLWVEAYDKKIPDTDLIIKTLSKASKVERVDSHHISILIGYLQSSTGVDFDVLANLEYSFYEILEDYYAKPITLERKIASQPDYFLQLTKMRYSLPPFDKKGKDEFGKIWHIFNNWRAVPGVDGTGNFNEANFNLWIANVQEKANKDNIVNEVNRLIGSVLIHSPKEENGIPIKPIAEILEATPKALDGFRLSLYNSRGVHSCSSKEELTLVVKYKALKEAARSYGYRRLSEMYGNFEEEHLRDAKQYSSALE